MPKFMISVVRDINARITIDDGMMDEIDKLNDDMVNAGIRLFVGGLRPIGEAEVVPCEGDGRGTKEAAAFLDGFWVVDCATIDEARSWAQMASRACRSNIEIRQFYD